MEDENNISLAEAQTFDALEREELNHQKRIAELKRERQAKMDAEEQDIRIGWLKSAPGTATSLKMLVKKTHGNTQIAGITTLHLRLTLKWRVGCYRKILISRLIKDSPASRKLSPSSEKKSQSWARRLLLARRTVLLKTMRFERNRKTASLVDFARRVGNLVIGVDDDKPCLSRKESVQIWAWSSR